MPLRFGRFQAGEDESVHRDVTPARWTCGFVNNMPDGAFEATERQFLGLLDAGSMEDVVEVRRYTMPGVPRAEGITSVVQRRYEDISAIYDSPPDLLIVTGSNPIELEIRDEPYWDDLERLLKWSRGRTPLTLLSCLSAHAALAVYDGIERTHLSSKCTGVFDQEIDQSSSLCEGMADVIQLPHSRWNSVPVAALREAGYDALIWSTEVGWSVASKVSGASRLLLVQGHPEYDPSSLLREYRRDADRFVRRERDAFPPFPVNCVGPLDLPNLEKFNEDIVSGVAGVTELDAFPFEEIGGRAPWPWRTTAVKLYSNVLANIA